MPKTKHPAYVTPALALVRHLEALPDAVQSIKTYKLFAIPGSTSIKWVKVMRMPGGKFNLLSSTGGIQLPLGTFPLEAAVEVLASLYQGVIDAHFQRYLEEEEANGDIQIAPDYAEPGYSLTEKQTGVALANWNPYPREFGDWVEKHFGTEWSDEWTTCSDCGRVFRISGDSYGWKMYGTRDGDDVCGKCHLKDPAAYLEGLEGRSNTGVTLDIDPAEHGYLLVNEDRFESGWHPGQDDDPQAITKTLRKIGIRRTLWVINSVGQFDISFSLYLHEDHKDLVDDARKALGIQ